MTVSADASHILVVDDDRRLRELLQKFLFDQGFAVTTAEHAAQAEKLMGLFAFDGMVLDLMMPGESGIDFAHRIRDKHDLPILMLTAMSAPDDRVRGLESGADDYLTKPFEPRELVLRLQNLLKRYTKTQDKSIIFGPFRLDMASAQLWQGEQLLHLTTSEQQLLKALAESAGTPVSREQLAAVSGQMSERSVDVQITRLRKKIEQDASRPVFILTVRGSGYVLHAEK